MSYDRKTFLRLTTYCFTLKWNWPEIILLVFMNGIDHIPRIIIMVEGCIKKQIFSIKKVVSIDEWKSILIEKLTTAISKVAASQGLQTHPESQKLLPGDVRRGRFKAEKYFLPVCVPHLILLQSYTRQRMPYFKGHLGLWNCFIAEMSSWRFW